MTGIVEQIYIAPAGGQAMRRIAEAQALEACGLEGDRYCARRGYWTGVDECEVTFIDGEALDRVTAEHGVAVARGEHRRNIVTRGVDLYGLAGRRFAVGEALFAFDRPRPPCRYIAGLTERGMTRALGGRRGGICARVLRSGTVREGDAITVADEPVVTGVAGAPWRQFLRATRARRS